MPPAPRGDDVAPTTPRPASAESATGVPHGELEIPAKRMRGAAVSGRGIASSPAAREAYGPPAP
eukprot:5750459-Alexandrium_andersonii.AAC.1